MLSQSVFSIGDNFVPGRVEWVRGGFHRECARRNRGAVFSGDLNAGPHSFMWNTLTGFPDGSYECLIRMNGQMQTEPMLLMR